MCPLHGTMVLQGLQEHLNRLRASSGASQISKGLQSVLSACVHVYMGASSDPRASKWTIGAFGRFHCTIHYMQYRIWLTHLVYCYHLLLIVYSKTILHAMPTCSTHSLLGRSWCAEQHLPVVLWDASPWHRSLPMEHGHEHHACNHYMLEVGHWQTENITNPTGREVTVLSTSLQFRHVLLCD